MLLQAVQAVLQRCSTRAAAMQSVIGKAAQSS